MPKVVDHTQKKEEFLAASWDVIALEGLSGATLRRVAAEAGCTTGSLTRYFPDRNTLVIETLRSAHFTTASRMQLAAEKASSHYDRLEAILLESLPIDEKRRREWLVWVAFWGVSNSEPELLKEHEERYKEWQTLLSTLLEPLTSSKEENEREAQLLRALIDGMGLSVTLSSKRKLKEMQALCKAQLKQHLLRFRR